MSKNQQTLHKGTPFSRVMRAGCVIGALTGSAMDAHAVGVNSDPGDYTALPAGTQLGVAYYQHLSADNVRANGHKVVGGLDLGLDLGVLRYVRYVELGGWIANPQIIMPFGRQNIGLSGDTRSGLGDTTVGATFWPLHDLEGRHHFGIGTFATLPTGSAKNEGFALSSNRYAFNLQAGYQRPLSKNWTLELIGQSEFYTDQRDTNASKKTYLSLDASPRYQFSDQTSVALTWRHGWGGKEELNGVTLLGSERRDIGILTWASFLAPQWQLQLQYRQDFNVKDGAEIRALQSRLLYVF